jgi:hypothetical protein
MPREGIISLNTPDVNTSYFGEKPKQIFWRESRSLIVALIGDQLHANLPLQSVLLTFLLKEVNTLRFKELYRYKKALKRENSSRTSSLASTLLQSGASLIPLMLFR